MQFSAPRCEYRLFTVLYFSVTSSRSSALCYGLPSCMKIKIPVTVRRGISKRSHEKIGDCEQSTVNKTIHRTSFPTLLLFISLNAWGNTHSFLAYSVKSSHVRKSGFRHPVFWNPDYSSRNPESHWRLGSRIQVVLTNTGIQYLESGIYIVQSKTVLHFPTWSDFSNCSDFNWGMLDF